MLSTSSNPTFLSFTALKNLLSIAAHPFSYSHLPPHFLPLTTPIILIFTLTPTLLPSWSGSRAENPARLTNPFGWVQGRGTVHVDCHVVAAAAGFGG